jgi:Mn-dependent DtxR family transcriptional regulator
LSNQYSYDQIRVKRFYRFIRQRGFLLSIDSSGLYQKNLLKDGAAVTGISYNTIRADLKSLEKDGLIEICNKKLIRLKKMSGYYHKLYITYSNNRDDINNHPKPSLYFSDLVKSKILRTYLLSQANMESKKIIDPTIKRKYLKTVKSTTTALGVSHGINASLTTISKVFGKSKITAFNYINNMKSSGIISVKRKSRFICKVWEFTTDIWKNFINRTFYNEKDYGIYERLPNAYLFKK